jgi:hypothetical protein
MLLLPIHTSPPDTTGEAYESGPGGVDQRMPRGPRIKRPFLRLRSSGHHIVGGPDSALTEFRVPSRPSIGQSSACEAPSQIPTATTIAAKERVTCPFQVSFIRDSGSFEEMRSCYSRITVVR